MSIFDIHYTSTKSPFLVIDHNLNWLGYSCTELSRYHLYYTYASLIATNTFATSESLDKSCIVQPWSTFAV